MARSSLLAAILIALVCWTAFAGASPAAAQAALLAQKEAKASESQASASDSGLSEGLQAVIKQAESAGAQVIVIAPKGTAAAASDDVETPTEVADQLGDEFLQTTMALEDKLDSLVTRLPLLPGHILSTFRAASRDNSLAWIGLSVVLVAITVLAGALAYRLIVRWSKRHFFRFYHSVPASRSEKIGFLLSRGVVLLLAAGSFTAAGHVVGVLVTEADDPVRLTNLIVVATVGLGLAFRAVFRTLLCPDVAGFRPVPLPDDAARPLFRDLMLGVWAALFFLGLAAWMREMGLIEDAYDLFFVLAGFVASLVLTAVTLGHRRQVSAAILVHERGTKLSVFRRIMAQSWHVLVLAYIWAAWVVGTVRRLLDYSDVEALISGPVIALVVALAIYGILLMVIDRWLPQPQPEPEDTTASEPAPQPLGAAVSDADDMFADIDDDDELQPLERRDVGKAAFRNLFEHGAAIISIAVGIVLFLHLWGIPVAAEGHIVARFLGIFIVLFLSYMAYESVKVWVDGKIAAEQGGFAGGHGGGHGDAEMGQGATRLATLLPLFRNFLLITIASMAIMVGLAGIGVNIAPLFAGAGVVGLAIGFGAQTLIRDIFSGAFFLIDDAFRKGEYIDLGSVKGVVEKISIRSFQLRHQNGPLHTIPFGEVKRLTNYSRDWVIMKLPLRLTYDTDPEKVRKLVKKLGQQLLEDPDIGHMFLDPLKSQGVYQMEDSAMIIRVKFMTKPGDQFLVRKRVYAEIRDLFEREGIHFAHREVTVRIIDEDGNEIPEADRTKREIAAGAAARRRLDDEAEAAGKASGEDPSAAR